MKTRILIPPSVIGITADIQACLLLANQQGFEIDNIELGVSCGKAVELEVGGNLLLQIIADFFLIPRSIILKTSSVTM